MNLSVHSALGPAVRICGRTLVQDPLPLFWRGDGFHGIVFD